MIAPVVRPYLVSLALLAFALTSRGEAGPAAQAGKVLVIVQGTEPDILDAQKINVSEMENIARAINESLVRYNYSTKKLEPVLAESWRLLSDGLTWQFKIRRGVRFSNGEELDAEAVRYSYNRFVDRNRVRLLSDGNRLAGLVGRVEVVDKFTFNFVTKTPTPLFDFFLLRFAIVPPRYVESVGDEKFVSAPVGTGPFRFVEWIRGDRIRLGANGRYWRGRPKLEGVIFRFVPEGSSRTSALRAGEAHLATLVPFPDVPVLRAERGLQVIPALVDRSMFVVFNYESPALRDRRVRQALNFAVDKDLLIETIVGGYGRKLRGQLVVDGWGGFQSVTSAYPYDPKRARQLLQEAGYDFNSSLELLTPVGRYMQDKEVTEAVSGQLAAVGVKTSVMPMEAGLWVRRVFFDRAMRHLSMLGLGVPFPDASPMLETQLSDNANSFYKNAEYDRVVRQLRTAVDPSQRRSIIRQAVVIQREDPPGIFLYQASNIYGLSRRAKGFKPQANELYDLFLVSLE